MASFEKFNDKKYNLWGRKFPAIVCLTFPMLAIIYYYFGSLTGQISQLATVFKIILFFGTIIPSLFFFYTMTIRELSISLIELPLNWLFGKPTSNLLLPKLGFITDECKNKVKQNLKEYGIELDVNGKFDGKKADRRNRKYRHRVDEAIGVIKETERGDAILLEFNAVYGFFRNMTGGMLLNLLVWYLLSILNSLSDGKFDTEIQWSFWAILILVFIGLLFSITSRYRYAKRLLSLYGNRKNIHNRNK